MTDSLKWIVSGAAGLIFVGAIFGAHEMGARSADDAAQAPDKIVQASGANGYPAPEVTVMAQPEQDVANLSSASSLYGDGISYSRRRRSTHKKSKHKQTIDSGFPKDADPEMGFISADDKKLREAEAKAKHADSPGFSADPGPVGH